jgi:periplasmic divalent cation tolerance protein
MSLLADCVMLLTNSDQKDVLERIATRLVTEQLAACVQISGPVASYYRWEGKLQTADEWICSIKTTRAVCDDVMRVVAECHNYQMPEMIVLPIVGGSTDYLNWLRESVGPPKPP